MWYPETVTTAPSDEDPITLVTVKRHVHAEDFVDDDEYLKGLIAASRGHADKICNVSFAAQIVEAKCESWTDFCHVQFGPLGDVDVSYIDTNGVAQSLPGDVYEVRGQSIVLSYGQRWPAKQAGSLITVDAEIGFGAEKCPADVKHAMLLWIADAYRNRGTGELPAWTTMDALLSNHRYY